MLTEEEATTKWCPMARVKWAKRNGDGNKWNTTDGDPPFNVARIERAGDEYPVGHCIASACMMWRATTEETYKPLEGKTFPAGLGYCGLAGRPA